MISGNFAELVHIPVDSVTLEGMLVIPPGGAVCGDICAWQR